jgi:hypothetical protein
LKGYDWRSNIVSVKPFARPTERRRKGGGGGPGGPRTAVPGRIHYQAIRLQKLIVDACGVKEFQVAGDVAEPAGGSVQAGLKLEMKKIAVPVIEIDHIEKKPTGNQLYFQRFSAAIQT